MRLITTSWNSAWQLEEAERGQLVHRLFLNGHAVPWPWEEWHGRSMASVDQTRPHCVNQMGKTHSKPLAARHGRGTAWARHVVCESAFNVLLQTLHEWQGEWHTAGLVRNDALCIGVFVYTVAPCYITVWSVRYAILKCVLKKSVRNKIKVLEHIKRCVVVDVY